MDATPIPLDSLDLEAFTLQLVSAAAEKIYSCQGHGGLTVARAWLYQRKEQVKAMGAAGAPWYVGWIDPDGKQRSKSCGPGPDGKRNAGKVKRQVEAELLTGTYGSKSNATWREFRTEYERAMAGRLSSATQDCIMEALDHFERLAQPGKMAGIKTATIDAFTGKRLQEDSKRRPGRKVSPATVNKELRHLKAALVKAAKWDYLNAVPEFDFLRELEKLPTWIPPEDLAKLYVAADTAAEPACQGFTPGDWWRAFLVFGYLTGWRVGEILALRREDLDIDAGTALTRAEDNKGGRDALARLHPIIVEHLARLAGFSPEVFPWPCHRRTLDKVFHRLCQAAQVRRYGFHDLRRAFATMNADRLTSDVLQQLMRHKSYLTTQSYIDMARQLKPAAQNLHVPDFLQKKPG